MERETRRGAAQPGTLTPLNQVRLADRAGIRLGRKRSMVHHKEQASRSGPRHPDRGLCREQVCRVGAEASEAKPEACEDGDKETPSPQATQQKTHLFH